jgi:hypothetical protein
MVYQCAGCNSYSSHTIGLLFWRGIPMFSLGGNSHDRDLLVYLKRGKLLSRLSLRNRIVVMDFGLYTCRMARCYRPSPTFIVETGGSYLFLWFSFWVCLPAGRVLGWSWRWRPLPKALLRDRVADQVALAGMEREADFARNYCGYKYVRRVACLQRRRIPILAFGKAKEVLGENLRSSIRTPCRS